jgi:DNA ligase-1
VERRSLLAGALREGPHLQLAPWSTLEPGAAAVIVEERFEQARARGNEGLMLKRTDAPYAPGRRGRFWHKLKRELSTLDVVVVGVQWGHGKRHNVLSDYTFAVRRSAQSGELVTIGKAYSGLTDAEIATMTEWFLNHRTGELDRHVYAVAPEVVIEVAFDIIQKSDLHAGGYSLRFPRIVRLRPDKPARDADTLAEVERIYREMLEREGVAH